MKQESRRWSIAAALLTVAFPGLFVAAHAQDASNTNRDEVIPLIKMEDVPLSTAIENLARQASINCILDPKLPKSSSGYGNRRFEELIVTRRWENVTARQVLTNLLDQYRLKAIENPVTTVARIVSTNQAATSSVTPEILTNGTTRVIPLIQMQEVGLDSAFIALAKEAGITLNLDKSVFTALRSDDNPFPMPTVSFRWENLNAQQAIAALAETYNLAILWDASTKTYRVSPRMTR